MYSHLDRIVFSRQTECIPSHRMYNIISLLKFITAPYVRNYIPSPMSDMKTVSWRIRKHVKTVILLFFISVIIHSWIYRIFRPFFTPLFFNRFVIIHYLCTHMFLSFIHRYITHKRKPPVPENSRDEKAYFRGTTLVHPTGPGKLFVPVSSSDQMHSFIL